MNQRLIEHSAKIYKGSYTASSDDWELYYSLDNLELNLARKIEMHLKRMKSKKYLENLRVYPEMAEKLISRYTN